ncbi:MAG TPA: CBS domain-containing protein [Flexilinea sp.]|nr:CBS domain-containing protein [Flexilinea sp.]
MKIIVTHEQADFDAVASQLAASLLEPAAIPILPKRINRNVASFLKDFSYNFNFRTDAEIAEETVDSVLVVDTQAISNTAKIKSDTEVSVIDHHQPRLNLPEKWKCLFDRTGSCTTILVEQLENKSVTIDEIQAVMLLMGIYEDTGNLTYGSTTARDLQAAAWLMNQGADLNILNRYLNQPLSEPQQILAERLLQNCETLTIMGQQIVISQADARDINDEFSTVAHHLRDMFSPDAIFILLGTKGGIRIIGRATNDRIDVAQIMKHFNGGGHPRAAAGLIPLKKGQELPDVLKNTQEKLLEMLPQFITPPITVGQIMSTRPLLIDSQMPMEEIAELIQRYGYEGYPVVDKNKNLIGLLNRRSVDRALAFGLSPSVESIMDPGNYSVRPEDSVDYLKEMMNLSGWGQIPVINGDGHEIIGIVTRTDLIKILTGRSSVPGNRNYAQVLTRVLPPSYLTLIHMVADAAWNCRYPVYIVGGFVRDLILGQPVMDFDIVVEGDAIHLARTLVHIYGGKVRVHSRFGTAKWVIGDIHDQIIKNTPLSPEGAPEAELPATLDLISARTEFYDYPTAMPKVERSSIKLDLHRRDFTINTMALRLDGDYFGDLLDYWGGYLDLHQKLIRVLHSLSFMDDPTRMLRAVRFEKRFNFTIEKHTMMLLKDGKTLLKRISGRRIMNELDLFFHEESPSAGLSRLEELGLLEQIHPNIRWTSQNTANLTKFIQKDPPNYWLEALPSLPEFINLEGKYLIWWGKNSPETVKEIVQRLQLSQRIQKMLLSYSEICQKMPDLIHSWPSEVTFFLEKQSLEAIYCYDILSDDEKVHQTIRNFLQIWRNIKPFTTGSDLRRLPYPAGSWIGAVLDRLRKGWIDEEISSREEEEKTLEFILPLFTKSLDKKHSSGNPAAEI